MTLHFYIFFLWNYVALLFLTPPTRNVREKKMEKSLILEINEIENSNEANHSLLEGKKSSGKFKKRNISETIYTVLG